MIVTDASVQANALLYTDDRGRRARATLAKDPEWAVPDHWKGEVFSVIRGLALAGKITEERAGWAVAKLPRITVDQVSLDELLPRMWQLRSAFSAYDAPYVALAEARGLTLVTSDAPLARAATSCCRVELVS
jgi:predicted nucleic acid-binding protein